LQKEFPAANVMGLQALVRDTLREREAKQPPRAFRELYQALRALIERQVTNRGDD
jgi:ribosome-associated protein